MSDLVDRIDNHIKNLADFTSTPGDGITRIVYSKEDFLVLGKV